MAESYEPYVEEVRAAIGTALESMAEGNDDPESPEYPIVEMSQAGDKQVGTQDIWYSSREGCRVESSSNSVRCSFLFKQHPYEAACVNKAAAGTEKPSISPFVNISTVTTVDPIEKAICAKYLGYFQQRADSYRILRRKPVTGYTISFLIVPTHVRDFGSQKIVDIVGGFLVMADKEFSDARLMLNARTRFLTTEFMKAF